MWHIQFLIVIHHFITADKMERMESSYFCEVLHFLLRKRYGTPLVLLSVDLVDKDNEASLDLLCALFKHCECSCETLYACNYIEHWALSCLDSCSNVAMWERVR